MLQRPPERAERSEASWNLREVDPAAVCRYRTLFRRIGEDWLWTSRLLVSDDELRALLSNPRYEAYVFEASDRKRVSRNSTSGRRVSANSLLGLTPAMVVGAQAGG